MHDFYGGDMLHYLPCDTGPRRCDHEYCKINEVSLYIQQGGVYLTVMGFSTFSIKRDKFSVVRNTSLIVEIASGV
jgi:hypothetical protein